MSVCVLRVVHQNLRLEGASNWTLLKTLPCVSEKTESVVTTAACVRKSDLDVYSCIIRWSATCLQLWFIRNKRNDQFVLASRGEEDVTNLQHSSPVSNKMFFLFKEWPTIMFYSKTRIADCSFTLPWGGTCFLWELNNWEHQQLWRTHLRNILLTCLPDDAQAERKSQQKPRKDPPLHTEPSQTWRGGVGVLS